MIHALPQGLAPALARGFHERLTLLLNHVIASEPEAMTRLAQHAGQTIQLQPAPWPAPLSNLLPAPPQPSWAVTPPGLLELMADDATPAADGLVVSIEPRQWMEWALTGGDGAPPMSVQGDAAFATTLGWLAENLRWDLEDDLARFIGDGPARMAMGVARSVGQGVRALLARLRPGSPS